MTSAPSDFSKSSRKPTTRLFERLRQRSNSPFRSSDFARDLQEELNRVAPEMWFDDEPGFGGRPSRGRFPFREGSPFDDLASRHPMFAQHVRRGSPWEDPFGPEMGFPRGPGIPRDRTNSGGGTSTCSSAASASSGGSGDGTGEHVIPIHVVKSDGSTVPVPAEAPKEHQHQQEDKPDSDKSAKKPQQAYNTQRNTTEIPIQSVKQSVRDLEDSLRSQRAQSAPPSSFANNSQAEGTPRFVSKLSIDPQLPKPPQAQTTPPAQPPNMTEVGGNSSKNSKTNLGGSSGNIRHIPIFVEGRQANGNGQSHNVPDSRSREASPKPPTGGPQAPPQAPSSDQEDHSPPKKPTLPKDPMEVIHLIVQDVQSLVKEVEQFTGTMRTAKDYIYLDEMLTRNLIKLDVIETDGREDVRQARRDCIKLIQGTISQLEAKVPLPEEKTEDMEIVPVSNGPTCDGVPVDTNITEDQKQVSLPLEPSNTETPMEVTTNAGQVSAPSQN